VSKARDKTHASHIRSEVVRSLKKRRPGRKLSWLGAPRLYDLMKVPPSRVALVVIDMQAGFFPFMPKNYAIVPNINRLASALRSLGGVVCWITSDVGPDALENWSIMYDNFFVNREEVVKRQLREGGVDFGSNYDAFAARHGMDGPLWWDLDLCKEDMVVKKDRHSALALGGRHQGRTAEEGPVEGSAVPASFLESKLLAAGVDTLLIAGCATNCCCEATSRDAMQRNFRVVMLADACAAATDADHNGALNNCVQFFGDVMMVDEVVSELEVSAGKPSRL